MSWESFPFVRLIPFIGLIDYTMMPSYLEAKTVS